MLFLLGVLVMVVGIAVSIGLHECGHMVPAKKFGVRVPQYMIGFGPTVWSRRRGETEYGIKAIPLGGYVRMIGMYPPRPGDPEGAVRATSTGRFSQLADEVREQSYEELRPGDENRVFYKLRTWQKVVVMFGGPFMNLVIASVVTLIMLCGMGMPTLKGTEVAQVTPCLVTVSAGKACPAGQQSPAAAAGLRTGDRIVSVDGQAVAGSVEATRVIRAHGGQSIPFVVERDGTRRTIPVTPRSRTVPVVDTDGNAVKGGDGKVEQTTAGFVGLSIGRTVLERQSIADVPGVIGTQLKQTANVVFNIPAKLSGVAKAAFGHEKRDVNSPMSAVGMGHIAGDVAESPTTGLAIKVWMLLSLIASLNFALFVFNLVPVLPLDGGHIAGALWEAVKRPLARRRGVTTPVYADVTKALPIAYAMSVLLIGMSALLIYADIVKPISIN